VTKKKEENEKNNFESFRTLSRERRWFDGVCADDGGLMVARRVDRA